MPYRRTENVVRRLAAREQAILDAATALAAEGGMDAVQIAAVAERAGIAAGTVYRYFPSKTDLIAEVVTRRRRRANWPPCARRPMRRPGRCRRSPPRSPTFAARALAERSLTWAVTAEPVDADIDALRLDFRRALAAELEARIAPPRPAAICPSRTPARPAPADASAR